MRAGDLPTVTVGWIVGHEKSGLSRSWDRTCGPGGRIATLGVHSKRVELHVERLWSDNVTLTTRRVGTITAPTLLPLVQSGRLAPETLVSHRFQLAEIFKAYDPFENAAKDHAFEGRT